MDQWGYERDLKPDLFATQRGRGGQGRNLVKCAGKLNCRLNQCRALKRPLSRLTPQTCGLLDLPGLSTMTCQ